MRKTALVGSLFILSILLSGCIIVSSNKTQAAQKEHAKSPCVEFPQAKATMAEIDAAGKCSQSVQLGIYKAIARRPGLSPQERMHLINAVTTHLSSQSAKEEVLLALVNNPPVTVQPTPKQEITAGEEPLTEK